jgi:hypothetical protein
MSLRLYGLPVDSILSLFSKPGRYIARARGGRAFTVEAVVTLITLCLQKFGVSR